MRNEARVPVFSFVVTANDVSFAVNLLVAEMGKVVDVLKAILTRLIFAGHGFIGKNGRSKYFTVIFEHITVFLKIDFI